MMFNKLKPVIDGLEKRVTGVEDTIFKGGFTLAGTDTICRMQNQIKDLEEIVKVLQEYVGVQIIKYPAGYRYMTIEEVEEDNE